MFQGVGRAYPKGLVVNGGSKMLESTNKVFGWGRGGTELRSVSHAEAFIHYPEFTVRVWPNQLQLYLSGFGELIFLKEHHFPKIGMPSLLYSYCCPLTLGCRDPRQKKVKSLHSS